MLPAVTRVDVIIMVKLALSLLLNAIVLYMVVVGRPVTNDTALQLLQSALVRLGNLTEDTLGGNSITPPACPKF